MTTPAKQKRSDHGHAASSTAPARDVGRLSLTRREGEGLKIGDDVYVEIVGFRGSSVQLRITAPRSVVVERFERLEDDAYLQDL